MTPSSGRATTSFQTDIRPLFRPVDVNHMNRRQLDLSNYDDVKNNAGAIYDRVKSTDDSFRMPRPPDPPWSQDKIDLFKRWMDEGFPP